MELDNLIGVSPKGERNPDFYDFLILCIQDLLSKFCLHVKKLQQSWINRI